MLLSLRRGERGRQAPRRDKQLQRFLKSGDENNNQTTGPQDGRRVLRVKERWKWIC